MIKGYCLLQILTPCVKINTKKILMVMKIMSGMKMLKLHRLMKIMSNNILIYLNYIASSWTNLTILSMNIRHRIYSPVSQVSQWCLWWWSQLLQSCQPNLIVTINISKFFYSFAARDLCQRGAAALYATALNACSKNIACWWGQKSESRGGTRFSHATNAITIFIWWNDWESASSLYIIDVEEIESTIT